MPNVLPDNILELKSIYRHSQMRLKDILEAKTSRGLSTQYTKDLLANIDDEIRVLNQFSEAWMNGNIPGEYGAGIDEAYQYYRNANVQMTKVMANNRALTGIINSAVGKMTDANLYMGRQIQDEIRQAGIDAVAEKITQGQTIKQMQRSFLDRLTNPDTGLLDIKDKNGRSLNPVSYAEMVSRTTVAEATNRGTMQQVQDSGFDLVKMSSTYATCPICAVFEGRVYSISGRDKRYPKLSKAFPSGYSTVHPNCTHNLLPYIEELDPDAEKTRELSNRDFVLHKDEQAAVDRYNKQQAVKTLRNKERRDWEQLRLNDPQNTSKTFSGYRAQQRSLRAKKEALPKMSPLEKTSLDYKDDEFSLFVRENKDSLKKADMFSKEKATELWKDARYKNSSSNFKAIDTQSAVDIVKEEIPENVRKGWFVNADSGYKPRLEASIIGNPELRNAGLNIAHKNYMDTTGEKISFDGFLNKDISVYRGGNDKFIDTDVFKSYSFDENIARKFAGDSGAVNVIKIKPKETLGSYQLTGEAEILIRNK